MGDQSERRKGQEKGRRRGDVFPVRVTPDERARLEAMQGAGGGPRSLGPWLVWRALGEPGGSQLVLPELGPIEPPASRKREVLPARVVSEDPSWRGDRVILDLCGGTGAWSRPYFDAGYDVRILTLPDNDVRTWEPPPGLRAWGVLAAPPCDQFSLARNGHPDLPRDFAAALETVCGCLRIIGLVRPEWWALENPTGHLGRWLGTPRDVWEPCDFGDPWTKRTAIWGAFELPLRGPFVNPESGAPTGSYENRARTPPGFARAFFEANP
jgi:hypothetical protein